VDVFIICLFVLAFFILTVIFRSDQPTLDTMRSKCLRLKKLNVFIDGGPDPDLAMECVCRALDASDCPENVQVYVLVPLSSSLKPTVWDSAIANTCAAFPRYNTYFESSVHIYKMSLKSYGQGGLNTVAYVLNTLESIHPEDLVVWLPYLSKLELNWDSKLLEDWISLKPESVLSFPLQHAPSLEKGIEDMIMFKKISSLPCFYFLTPDLDISIRPQANPELHKTLYLSTGYPMVLQKKSFITSKDDFSTCYEFEKQNISLYVSKHSLGFTLMKTTTSQSLQCKDWLELVGIKNGVVSIRALMGMSAHPNLSEKILKYGSEIKYQSFKEMLLMEGYQE